MGRVALTSRNTNNFVGNVGVGEREARIYSDMISDRYYSLGHGIGRSDEFVGIIYPVLFEYLDTITIRNVIKSTDGFKFMPNSLINRYWSKKERTHRLNLYQMVAPSSDSFEYELIRINITSPKQFADFYFDNHKLQQNLETKIISYYIALKYGHFGMEMDQIQYDDLNLKVISVDLWHVLSWCSSQKVNKITHNDHMLWFNAIKPDIECILWNAKEFNHLNENGKLMPLRDLVVGSTSLTFGFHYDQKRVFENVGDALFLRHFLTGTALIKDWYATHCRVAKVDRKGSKTQFNQIYALIDEGKDGINGWDRYSANYDDTQCDRTTVKFMTFITWQGERRFV